MHSHGLITQVQERLSRTVVNLIKVIIQPTVDLSPGHASIPRHQASSAGRPRMRSVHLPTRIPVASKAAKPRAKSVSEVAKYKAKVKGTSMEKLGKTAIVISSDSEVSSGEVDIPNLSIPNQALDLLAEEQEQPNQPLNIPAEEPDQSNNPNPLPENLPVPMANQHLNCLILNLIFQENQKKTQRCTF